MTKLWLRCILAFHMAFLILAVANCQFEDDEDDELSSDDASLTSDYDEETPETETSEYTDNRIDAAPTFVSPVEKFIRAITVSFGWITQTTSARSSVDRNFSETSRIFHGFPNIFAETTDRSDRSGFSDVLNMIGDRFKAVYPGTEWCGAGNVAKNAGEIGLFKKTDSCCKEHDQCNVSLEAGTSERGLRNNGIFTRSHCLCDAKFYYCLKEARSIVATNIGVTYFNILRPQCFKYEHPALCAKSRLRNNKCLTYSYNYFLTKTWQWFDSPDFL
ncbi:uncharacterized protein LOC131665268 isoform X2 [Phymastichus coffea]|uniref:uncharacterized protein LOC131665268 isoform X2 n=1 Tax=Phymastichus coffea TaxID=108790 RepID=UPI00273BDCB6|nr:uncharacterized protein LOC131665268 isoform X2 [Phymastichus coffea]